MGHEHLQSAARHGYVSARSAVAPPQTDNPFGLTDEDRRDLTSRSFAIRQDSLNEETRTVSGTISTESVVTVFDWNTFRQIDEVLLNSGFEAAAYVPLLDNHRRWSNDDVFGSLDQFSTTSNGIECRMTFVDMTARPDTDEQAGRVERAWIRLRQRHQRNLSAGYRVLEYVEIPPGKTKLVGRRRFTAGALALRVATKWILREGSLTPIGADQAATTRSDGSLEVPIELRDYLQSLGLRSAAQDSEAWAYFGSLTGAEADQAGKLLGRTMPRRTATPSDGDEPPAEPGEHLTPPAGGRNEPDPLPEPNTPPAPGAQRADGSPDVAAAVASALQTERERCTALRTLFDGTGQDEMLQAALADGTMTAERAAVQLVPRLRQQRSDPAAPEGGTGHLGIHSRGSDDITLDALAGALLMRSADNRDVQSLQHPSMTSPGARTIGERGLPSWMQRDINDDSRQRTMDQAHRLSGLNMIDFCRHALRLNGHQVPVGYEDIVQRAFSTNALEPLFTTSINARMLASYVDSMDTTEGWVSTEDVGNFKQNERTTMGKVAKLTKHARGGKADMNNMSATQEFYRIARYSSQWAIDEMDVIDDHFGASNTETPEDMGRAARQLRPDLVYSILAANPSLNATGGPVFAAGGEQDNLGPGALSIPAIEQAEVWFGEQLINGRNINLMMRYLIVPRQLKWLAMRILGSNNVRDNEAAGDGARYGLTNPISGEDVTLIYDARFGPNGVEDPDTGIRLAGSATQWLVTARPGEQGAKTLVIGYRRGTGRTPTTRASLLQKGCWGYNYDIKHDIGGGPLDWRGMKKYTG